MRAMTTGSRRLGLGVVFALAAVFIVFGGRDASSQPAPSQETPSAPGSAASPPTAVTPAPQTPADTTAPSAAPADATQPTDAAPHEAQPSAAAEPSPLPAVSAPPVPLSSNAGGSGAAPGDPAQAPTAAAGPPAGPSSKGLPRDLSPWGMFLAADIAVKAVMIGLAFASFVTWTVWLAKAVELAGAKRRLRHAIAAINSARSLGGAVERLVHAKGTGAFLVREAAEELLASAAVLDHADGQGIKERVTSRLARVEAAAGRRMTFGTGVLATIGATAPFVGLFGTVWGIMNAFIGISEAQTTNLAVVAPGIAEALLATAIGLVAAIPAVIIYNVFARAIAGYRLLLADASAGIERLVSRDLDVRRMPHGASAALPLARAAE